jgi:hypothetical protein
VCSGVSFHVAPKKAGGFAIQASCDRGLYDDGGIRRVNFTVVANIGSREGSSYSGDFDVDVE